MNISIGLTVSEGDSASHLEELIQQADRAVLRAKKDGRNRIVIAGGL